jgi:hypothetical protein
MVLKYHSSNRLKLFMKYWQESVDRGGLLGYTAPPSARP